MFLFAVLCIYNIFYQITDKIAPSDTGRRRVRFFLIVCHDGRSQKSVNEFNELFSVSEALSLGQINIGIRAAVNVVKRAVLKEA